MDVREMVGRSGPMMMIHGSRMRDVCGIARWREKDICWAGRWDGGCSTYEGTMGWRSRAGWEEECLNMREWESSGMRNLDKFWKV